MATSLLGWLQPRALGTLRAVGGLGTGEPSATVLSPAHPTLQGETGSGLVTTILYTKRRIAVRSGTRPP